MDGGHQKKEVEHMTFEEELKNEKNPLSIKIGSIKGVSAFSRR